MYYVDYAYEGYVIIDGSTGATVGSYTCEDQANQDVDIMNSTLAY